MSAQVTERSAGYAGARRRRVGFLEYASGFGGLVEGAGFQLNAAPLAARWLGGLPAEAERVYVIGAPPAAWGGWARSMNLPAGWAHSPRGHHLPRDSASTPALRFTRENAGDLELRNAAEWFGAGALSARDCREAWLLLAGNLLNLPGGVGGELLASPSQTGRDLLARTLPRGHAFPVLPVELREQIAATSPQGRVELLPAARARIPGLFELDARTAYGACLRQLGSGLVSHDDSPELPARQTRCRLRVRVTVPAGWVHVGLLGTRERPYRYPRTPGETFETWCEGWEAQTAAAHGWQLDVLERIIFEQGAPLDTWAKILRRLSVKLEALAVPSDLGRFEGVRPGAELAARAVRNMLITTVGAFAQTGYRVTHTTSDPELVPAGVAFAQDEAGGFVWEQRRALEGSAAKFSHPEWAAQVWGRARVRLLETPTTKGYPTRTGALAVPFAHVVAMRTDALYLTHRPSWPDDGEWGRYRLKGAGGPRRWPADVRGLLAARDAGRLELAAVRG